MVALDTLGEVKNDRHASLYANFWTTIYTAVAIVYKYQRSVSASLAIGRITVLLKWQSYQI